MRHLPFTALLAILLLAFQAQAGSSARREARLDEMFTAIDGHREAWLMRADANTSGGVALDEPRAAWKSHKRETSDGDGE